MKVTRTTFEIYGCKEPCIIVDNEYGTQVRISKMYHYIGDDALCLREYIDGEFNAEDEWNGDFDELTDSDALILAKKFSVYL